MDSGEAKPVMTNRTVAMGISKANPNA
ncbi:uncharacterized protein METZ01_LOCUS49830, partial [marine metagenome]